MIIFAFSDLERSMSRSLIFGRLVSPKGSELGYMLPLTINRKPYMGSPITLSHFTLNDLEKSLSMSLGFRSLISCKGAELSHTLLLNINKKAYMGSPLM